MTMTHDELRKLAEAATPGPWDLGTKPEGKYTSGTIKKNGVEIAVTWPADWNDDYDTGSLPYKENAAFIAAANPKKVLELLDEIADLKLSAVAFAGVFAVEHAKLHGLPKDHLYSHHYDLLEKCGARMADFKRYEAKP